MMAAAMHLDFQRNNRRGSRLGMALIYTSLVLSIALIAEYRSMSQELAQWQSRLESRQAASPQSPAEARPVADSQQLQHAADSARLVVRQLATPWDRLLNHIEATTRDDVTLLSIQPNLQNRQVHISGESESLRAALHFMERLGKKGILRRVFLVAHETRQENSRNLVHFSLVAEWLAQ